MVGKSEIFGISMLWTARRVCSQHIYPLFAPPLSQRIARVVSDFWAPDVGKVLAAKLRDNEYEKSLCQRFEDAAISDEGEDSEH